MNTNSNPFSYISEASRYKEIAGSLSPKASTRLAQYRGLNKNYVTDPYAVAGFKKINGKWQRNKADNSDQHLKLYNAKARINRRLFDKLNKAAIILNKKGINEKFPIVKDWKTASYVLSKISNTPDTNTPQNIVLNGPIKSIRKLYRSMKYDEDPDLKNDWLNSSSTAYGMNLPLKLRKGAASNPTSLERRIEIDHELSELLHSYNPKTNIDDIIRHRYRKYPYRKMLSLEPKIRKIAMLKFGNHNPTVLNDEEELRSELYPLYQNRSNKKRTGSFHSGKYQVSRLNPENSFLTNLLLTGSFLPKNTISRKKNEIQLMHMPRKQVIDLFNRSLPE